MALETLASTSLLLVNSAASPNSDIVLLSSFTQGFPLTVRDIGGQLTSKEIIISTITDSHFLEGPGVSSYSIQEPFGSLTFYPRLSNVWELFNTFAFPSFSNLQVNSISTSIANFKDTRANNISTAITLLSSAAVATDTPTSTYPLIISSLNTTKFLRNQVSIFELSDPSTFFTSSLTVQGVSPFTTIPAMTISSTTSFYTSTPTIPSLSKNIILSLSNRVQFNSSLTVSSAVLGLNNSTPQESIDISGIVIANVYQTQTSFYTGLTNIISTSLMSLTSTKLFISGSPYEQQKNLDILTLSSLSMSNRFTFGLVNTTSTLQEGLFSTMGDINVGGVVTGGSVRTSTITFLSNQNTSLSVENTTRNLLLNGLPFSPPGKLTDSFSTLQVSSIKNIYSPFTQASDTIPVPPLSIVLPVGNNTNVPGGGGTGAPQNTYVLCIPGGEYKYSTDGISFTSDTAGIPFNQYAITSLWTGTFWLTATFNLLGNIPNGITRIYTSTDGIVWSAVTPTGSYPNKAIRNLIWTGSEILAVGDRYTNDCWIASSTDGISWTSLISPSALDGGSYSALKVAGGPTNGRIWLGGYQFVPGINDLFGLVYSDDNGANYTPATFPGYTGAIAKSIVTDGTIIVAAYEYTPGILYTSKTSSTFSNAAFAQSGFDSGQEVIYTGTQFAAIGWNGTFTNSRLQLSPDGVNWTENASFPTWAKSLCWDGTKLYVSGIDIFGSQNTFIYYTSDFTNWISTITPTTSESGQIRCTSNTAPSGGLGVGVKVDTLYFKGERQTQDPLENMIQISTNFTKYNSLTTTSGSTQQQPLLGIQTIAPSYTFDVLSTVNASSILLRGEPLNFRNATLTSTINVSSIQPLLNETSITVFGTVAKSVGGVPELCIGDFLVVQQSSLTQSMSTSVFSTSSSNLIVRAPTQVTIDAFVTVNNRHTSAVWVTVGRDTLSNVVKYSGDGLNWSNTTGATGTGLTEGWAVAYNGRQWLTATNNSSQQGATFFTSANGISWSQVTTSGTRPNGAVQDICWTGSFWVAVGTSTGASPNTISRSADGISWTPASSGAFVQTSGVGGFGVSFNGYRLVAVGWSGGGAQSNQSIKYSDNQGLTWTSIPTNGFTSVARGIAWNGRLWVAVGANATSLGTIKYSFDGITWTNSPANGFSSQGWDVKWNGSIFVAVGQDAAGNTIKYSQDGITWSNAASGQFSSSSIGVRVAWNGSFWVVVGTGTVQNERIKYSFDAITWFNSTGGPHNQQSFGIGYSSNVFASLQTEQLTLYSRIPTFIPSTNQIFQQVSTLTFNTSLQVNQPSLTGESILLADPVRFQILGVSSISVLNNPPLAPLDITIPSGTFTYPVLRNSVANDTPVNTFLTNFPGSNATVYPTNTTNTLVFYFKDSSTNYKASLTGATFFTGQHGNVSADPSLTQLSLKSLIGQIVRTTDDPPISYRPDGTVLEGKDAIWITETLPQIALTTEDKDPRVWGVISDIDNSDRFAGSPNLFPNTLQGRIRINGLGEGAIWVTNLAGPIVCGDFICSSSVSGLGRRQDDDKVHTYTVAKATMSCDFSLTQDDYICEEFEWKGQKLRKAFVGCVYFCS